MTIEELKKLKESENKVEFKEAKGGNFSYNGGGKPDVSKRRRCILGYVVAFANEGGGMLVFGMEDNAPHKITGTNQNLGTTGELQEHIYSDTGIRIRTEELSDENNLRVFIIHIPSWPIGKVYKFEDVPLMRVGEELLPMSDKQYLKIIQEQEPDFSAKICENLKIEDLDNQAIHVLKSKYAQKQNNPSFRTLSAELVLTDLKLMRNNKLTYAALILLGKEEIIRENLAQARTVIEYRRTENQTQHSNRIEIQQPLFLAIDKIWDYLNQPASNPKHHLRQKAYIFDIPFFNEDVIREAVMNAIVHRNYHITSNIFIRQYPNKIEITNPGGFPLGVTKENILKVDSTPRSELLSEILLKTGLVEKSGQGVDKIFGITLLEGKNIPDYSQSDDFTVRLTISAEITDEAFHIWLNTEREKRNEDKQLGYFDIITLSEIKHGKSIGLDKDVLKRLEQENLIRKVSSKYLLNDEYYELAKVIAQIGKYSISEIKVISECFYQFEKPKMGDFEKAFQGLAERNQIKYIIEKLVDDKILVVEGVKKGTKYILNKEGMENDEPFIIIKKRILDNLKE